MDKKSLISEQQQFSEILQQIQSAKKRAVQQVNNTLVELYWNIGKHISSQVELDNWGKNTVEQLAKFIQNNAPETKGFTASNLWRMKQFHETYEETPKLATLWRVLPWSHNRRIMTLKIERSNPPISGTSTVDLMALSAVDSLNQCQAA